MVVEYDQKSRHWIDRDTNKRVPSPNKGKKPESKSKSGGIDCPTGFEKNTREPACGKSQNPEKCKKSMWGKPVQYCKKPEQKKK